MPVDLKDKAVSIEVFRYFFNYLNGKKVSKERKINNHSLEEDVNLIPSDIGAIPDREGSVELSHIKNQGSSNKGKFFSVDDDGSTTLREINEYLPLSGGALTGDLSTLPPTSDSHAANKGYVDSVGDAAKSYAKTTAVQLTLTASGWVGDSAPFAQTVAVDGLTDGRQVMVYPAYGDDIDTNIAMREACAAVSYAKRSGSNVTFTCLEDKPGVDIGVIAEVYV